MCQLARELGLEPRTTQSKCVVLPLHHSRTETWYQELDSNQPHLVLQTSALPDELPWHW